MTTTPELHELAKDPQAFDTVLARITTERDKLHQEIARANDRMHELARDRKSYRNTRVPVWGMSDREVEQATHRAAAHDDQSARVVLTSRAAARAMLDAIVFEIANMDAVYARQGNRWTRFFPSVTKSQPHIHRSLSCHTLHPTTVMTWAPQLSGRTDEQAVAELDEALCSVCFPDAPVALHEYVSRKSQAAQDERAAEKRARDDAKAAKQLTDAEQAEMGRDRHGDRVTTVAKLKEIVRDAIEAEVESAFWATHSPEGWDAEHLARRRANAASDVPVARERAAKAKAILFARYQVNPAWGADWDMITRMEDSKRKSATKAWS